MNAAVKPGIFISFEGGDGAGKSTQIKRLADRLKSMDHDVVVTREPGGSAGAEAIRKLLVEGDSDRWSPLCEALLMYTARADHLERTILPALEKGAIVITDRFADSTMAYQGIAGALGAEAIKTLHDLVVGERDPDLTIMLDLPVGDGLKRADITGGEGRFESKGEAFQARVREAFMKIAHDDPQRCAIIDARGGIDDVENRILAVIRARIPELLGG